ncbi:NAD(P)-dependent oxidoreductase [Jannaschia seohaensis]|uniref:NADH-flavin reductase n=1 Tax=Jannaschia seohaensis TaxID=475081 RepID=A0A2Y9C8Q5_9RHOB|nr:NAD(P)H-binding protein [Jannaschia seohaensis]PWJ15064.1 putative NADH-flavin reductase [Jannaschia seohaensis]SSA49913.1 Putative NADH-flavin reductase [Jannaschia seohaensis]
MHLTIFGAQGATGTRLVDAALAAGHVVRAIYHATSMPERRHDRLSWQKGDLMKREGLEALLQGTDAVLNAVGIEAGPRAVIDPPKLHSQGTLNLILAMRAVGVDRLVTISASFVETRARGPIWFRAAAETGLRAIFEQLGEMERLLRATETLRWTAVRPGWLLDEGPSGDYRVFPEVIPEDLIRTRTGDLAAFMLACAERDLHIRKTPAIARPEDPAKSGPDAVLREIVR